MSTSYEIQKEAACNAERPKGRTTEEPRAIDLQRGHLSPDHELQRNLHWGFNMRIETTES
jgi:hypothetical protein